MRLPRRLHVEAVAEIDPPHLFVPDDRVKQLILDRSSSADIEAAVADRGWLTLEQSAMLAAVTGQTSMEETVRVLPTT